MIIVISNPIECDGYVCVYTPAAIIPWAIFWTIVSIYFTMVVHSYVQRRKSKEEEAAAANSLERTIIDMPNAPVVAHPFVPPNVPVGPYYPYGPPPNMVPIVIVDPNNPNMKNLPIVPVVDSHPYVQVNEEIHPYVQVNEEIHPYVQFNEEMKVLPVVPVIGEDIKSLPVVPIVDDHPYGQTSEDIKSLSAVPAVVDDHPYGQTSEDMMMNVSAAADGNLHGQTSTEKNNVPTTSNDMMTATADSKNLSIASDGGQTSEDIMMNVSAATDGNSHGQQINNEKNNASTTSNDSVSAATDSNSHGQTSNEENNVPTTMTNVSATADSDSHGQTSDYIKNDVSLAADNGQTSDDIKTNNDSKTTDDVKANDDIKSSDDSKTSDDIKTSDDSKTSDGSITSDDMKTGDDGKTSDDMKMSDDNNPSDGIKTSDDSKTSDDMKTNDDDSIRIASPNKEDAFIYVKVQTIASIVFNALISFGAGFGLFVLTYANTASMLSIYSQVAYGILGITIISHLLSAITWTVFKTEILKSCIRSIPATVFASDDEKNSVCNDGWRDFLGSIIMIAVISILLSLYFAIVISSYAKKRNEKETTGAKQHQYEKTSQL
ncbi:hypothetical protein RclHR1_14330002 [Rhizophagus clarus]|uniref:MARVEL domain-containing protein n=1 Tax=Rhizophagus clarus TaxID=94130 RepID=A0A2Z6QCB6_9GLOM|nr:hypothetical protein RclHR1_14330002 [Rhizophagus clarus]